MARKFDVAVMHDFFVDRLVHVESLSGVTASVRRKAAAGGGGVHGVAQEEVRGGNAVNLAHALARLGMRTLLITHSDSIHESLVRAPFKGLHAEVKVKPLPAGLTVAFEEKVNVMRGAGGGAADFGPSLLDETDWGDLENSRVVCSVNWAVNRRGTELLIALRKRLGEEKPIFLDPADFRDSMPGFKKLLGLIAARRVVDWISTNEVEGIAAGRALGLETSDLAELCRRLALRLGVVYDLHAVRMSYSSEGTRVAKAAVTKARSKRLTGAGDVWDAGAIYGRLSGMEEGERLAFANRTARLYLQSEDCLPPTLEMAKARG